MRGFGWDPCCGGGRGGCEEEGAVVFGAGAGVDEGFVGEGDGVYGGFRRGWWRGGGGFVGVVEEEGAAVGEADVLVCEVFCFGRVGWEGEDFVVVLRGDAFWHGCR